MIPGLFGKKEKSTHDGEPRHLMAAIMSGILLVAFADDELNQDEKDTIIELAEASAGGRRPAEQILIDLDGMVNLLAKVPEKDWPALFVEARDFSGRDKRLILRMCLRMSLADGHCIPEEREMIGKIAGWINIARRDLEIWNEEVAPVIAEAEADGVRFTYL